MRRYAELEARMERLRDRAQGGADAALLAEMEDVLTRGYAFALDGDARCRRLRRRVDNLTRGLPEQEVAKELRRLALEQRSLEQATRELRCQLAATRAVFVRLSRPQSASA